LEVLVNASDAICVDTAACGDTQGALLQLSHVAGAAATVGPRGPGSPTFRQPFNHTHIVLPSALRIND
jgi:hypothetical protein